MLVGAGERQIEYVTPAELLLRTGPGGCLTEATIPSQRVTSGWQSMSAFAILRLAVPRDRGRRPSSVVEQLFRKQQVVGSNPTVGSRLAHDACLPKWRNRQTRYVQGVVGATPWEFKSPLRHPSHQIRPVAKDADGPGFARLHVKYASEVREMVAGTLPEESPGCKERGCPVKAGETVLVAVDSPDRHALARESNRDQACKRRVKRAILPAAISESAATRLLAKAGGREPSRRRRRDRRKSREMTIQEQNPAYPFLSMPLRYGAYSSIG